MSTISQLRPEILNAALALSLEWGENFGKPIDARIRARYPQLTADDAAALGQWCAEVKTFAFGVVEEEFPKIQAGGAGTATTQISAKYPQLDDENLSWLNSQGMYYAWHG